MGAPLHLIIPGIDGSGPDHWQSRWVRERPDCRCVNLGRWHDPDRDLWVDRLQQAIVGARRREIVLVAHSLRCLLVAWWVQACAGQGACAGVKAAMLVAPCDPEAAHDPRLRRHGPLPLAGPLPFPALVVASSNDPYAAPDRAAAFARGLGAQLVTVGAAGHINAESGLGRWREGEALLATFEDRVLRRTARAPRTAGARK